MTSTLDMMNSLQFSATQEASMDAAVAEAMKNVKSPEDAAKVMARMMSMMTQGAPALDTRAITKAMDKISQFVASKDTNIPVSSMSLISAHCAVAENMFKIFEMGFVDLAFRALEKLTGLRLDSKEHPTRKDPALKDANDSKQKQQAIHCLLYGVGEVTMNKYNRDKLLKDDEKFRFAARFLLRTTNKTYRSLLFKFFTEFSYTSEGQRKLQQYDLISFFFEQGLVDEIVEIWMSMELWTSLPTLHKSPFNMITVAGRGLLNMIQVEPARSLLESLGYMAKLDKLLHSVTHEDALEYVQRLGVSYLRYPAVDEPRSREDYERKLTHEPSASVVLRCSFCGVQSTMETKLRRCGGCGLVHYCGKECQTEHWKNGHRELCKKNSIAKK